MINYFRTDNELAAALKERNIHCALLI